MRLVRHPAVWSVPVMVLLVVALLPANDGFYEFWINYDAQGDSQPWERRYNGEVMRRTSGMLCGHLLAFVVGMLTVRRHRHAVAAAVALAGGLAAYALALNLAATARHRNPR